ncbi:MAG: hypothetical protein LC105_05790 [Chitinophagales bacterium]|nr:arginine deiminase family protein [Chitinophagales bacterium]MCZ2393346.1 hypothetical protein [Chitinophagales bacterium]
MTNRTYGVIIDVSDWDIQQIPSMDLPSGLLMVSPEGFEIVDIKNPYMANHIGKVNKDIVLAQWKNIFEILVQWKSLGVIKNLEVIKGKVGLEDMVFCANPFFAYLDVMNQPMILLSNMRHKRRQLEIKEYRSYFSSHSVKVFNIPKNIKIEGNGDLIAHPHRRLIWMGYGYRTDIAAADTLTQKLQTYIIPLHLVNEHFYHLDTCFCVIDEDHVAICRTAFDEESYLRIKQVFSFVFEISEKEAKEKFSLNSLVMSNQYREKYAIVPKGSTEMIAILTSLNVHISIVDTDEFIKSGGSVYCMKGFMY